jgi:hypothetical protein
LRDQADVPVAIIKQASESKTNRSEFRRTPDLEVENQQKNQKAHINGLMQAFQEAKGLTPEVKMLQDRVTALESANLTFKAVVETLAAKSELNEMTEILRKEMAVIFEASESFFVSKFGEKLV